MRHYPAGATTICKCKLVPCTPVISGKTRFVFISPISFFTMSKKWTSGQIIQFLEYYEQCPCLWDAHSDLYKDRNLREDAYETIARKININGFRASDVKAKIRSIRNAYTLELNKISKSKKSGAGTDEIYTPKIPWFAVADRILHAVVQIRDTQSTQIVSILFVQILTTLFVNIN